jgi:hypothetical protein
MRFFASRNSTIALKREHGPQLASYASRKSGIEPTISSLDSISPKGPYKTFRGEAATPAID